MKKYDNFCAALQNLKEIFSYEEPYNTVVLVNCKLNLNNHNQETHSLA